MGTWLVQRGLLTYNRDYRPADTAVTTPCHPYTNDLPRAASSIAAINHTWARCASFCDSQLPGTMTASCIITHDEVRRQ